MAQTNATSSLNNYEIFRDILSSVLIECMVRVTDAQKPQKRSAKKKSAGEQQGNGSIHAPTSNVIETTLAEDLAEFIEYIASELFQCLLNELQSLEYRGWRESVGTLQTRYSLPLNSSDIPDILVALDPAIEESLVTYRFIVPDVSTSGDPENAKMTQGPGLYELTAPVLTTYITACTTPPPPPISTKAETTSCEICGRDWINLTYHHLIPRMVHAKVVKQGWHHPDQLQNVAWLCGARHRFVHHFADHETLARRYYTVGLLLEAPEVVAFATWVGRLRWKGLGSGPRRRKP